MRKIQQVFTLCGLNFRRWHKNPRIWVTFCLAFILCFLLTEKAVSFAAQQETSMQLLEPFVWSFGDSYSILLSSLLLVLIFSDMPFLNASSPLYLYRTSRSVWICGQLLYIGLATLLYLFFTLFSTALLCMRNGFVGNVWSETAAILGYSGMGQKVALPALIKTLELSTPYQSSIAIFILMLFYTLFLMTFMMYLHIRKGHTWAILGTAGVSLFGLLLNRQVFMTIFHMPDSMMYLANVITGWVSPLNQATYHMHNFGYDLLPTLWQTYLFFGALIGLFLVLSFRAMSRYNFSFAGTEKGIDQ